MKNILAILFSIVALASTDAQNIFDGLRYTEDQTTGSARFNAMSGAFGALGGETSSIAINPAGSAIMLQNRADVTLSSLQKEHEATYFGTAASSDNSDFTIGQAGVVFVFDINDENTNWRKFTLGLNYNEQNNFEDQQYLTGFGTTSIDQFFLQQAQGVELNLLQLQSGESISDLYSYLGENFGVYAQNAFLGYQGYIFDPVENTSTNTQYVSNVGGTSFDQESLTVQDGYNGKYTLNLAAQYGNNLFFGLNLNSHVLEYQRSNLYIERNSSAASSISYVEFQNNLNVVGSGFSAQAGMIGKVTEQLRLGLTYDTPTWMTISEETSQYLETDRTEDGTTLTEIIDPRVINVYADYKLKTPGKWTASAAYVFGAQGLLSFDYSYKDYSNIEFRPENDPAFADVNNSIDNLLKAVSTYRLGGEYRINNFSLRGGYHYEESPFEDETTIGDLSGFSLGAGYNFGNFSLDASYSRSERERNQQLFDFGLTDSAMINTTYSSLLFTLGFSI